MRPIAGLVDFKVQGCTFFIYIYLDRVPMNKIFFLDSFSYSGKYVKCTFTYLKDQRGLTQVLHNKHCCSP